MPLNITARTAQPAKTAGDVIVVGVWTLSSSKKAKAKSDLSAFDRALGGGLSRIFTKESFKGKKDQAVSVSTLGKLPAAKLIILGLGDRNSFTDADARSFSAKATRASNGEK